MLLPMSPPVAPIFPEAGSTPFSPLAALRFAGSGGLTIWILLATLLAAALVLWSYRADVAAGMGRARRWTCVVLKLAGLALLAACLLEPVWTGRRARPGANLFAVVADNSRSLEIQDAGASAPRAEEVRKLLLPENENGAPPGWQTALADSFDVRRYTFDASLQNVTDFSALDFQGRSTALGAALRTLAERFRGRPLAGALVLTDGNATDFETGVPPDFDFTDLPPVYPVVIGGTGAAKDLAVGGATVTQTAFEDAPVTVRADVTARGFAGKPLLTRLIDAEGKTVAEQRVDAPADGETRPVRFQFKPERPGLSFYQLRVALADAPKENGPEHAEATLANNAAVLAVDRGQGPYRILYVAGRPNWEYKFLNRALDEDREVWMTGLIRVAKREPKFDFRGRAGETGNPLFRGFGDQSREEAGSYDQPVLVRLNTRDADELRAGFPRAPEELFTYHAVIVDDLESEFFPPDQAALLEKFVSERGGGFLMLGGQESFREGGYTRTPVGNMLPVYLDGGGAPEEGARAGGLSGAYSGPFQYGLDREGWLQPWARLRDNERDERRRLESMPPLRVLNRVRGVKPGASVVATAKDAAGRPAPGLVVQRYGRGRTAALLIGDIWRWGMKDAEARADMEKAWRQLARWLVSDVPGRVSVSAEPPAGDASGALELRVRVRDAKFQPVDNATVSVEVETVTFGSKASPGGEASAASNDADKGKLVLRAEPSLEEPGLYLATYVPRQSGGFRFTAKAVNAAGAEEGRAETGWAGNQEAREFRSLTPNLPLLEEIARRTGGTVIRPDGLEELVRRLPLEKSPVMEAWSRPLWHTPWIFLAAILCFGLEWMLRRRQGLP